MFHWLDIPRENILFICLLDKSRVYDQRILYKRVKIKP
jgi:hypothetical protein